MLPVELSIKCSFATLTTSTSFNVVGVAHWTFLAKIGVVLLTCSIKTLIKESLESSQFHGLYLRSRALSLSHRTRRFFGRVVRLQLFK